MEEKKNLIKEADLLKMLGSIIESWKLVFLMTLCFAIFGVIISFSTPKEYTAEVVVAPEASGSSFAGSGLGSLASMVGMDLSSNTVDAIYPMLYPDIIKSTPFLASLFDVRVQNLEGSVDTTYYAYIKDFRERTWLDKAKNVPSNVKNWMTSFLSSSPAAPPSPQFNPYMLSKSQKGMVDRLDKAIGIFVDKKTDVITLSFTDRDSRVAAAMADTIMNRLQQEVTLYRTKKSIDDCRYIERMYHESKDSLDVSQQRYADFVSRNRNVVNEFTLIEKERLDADKELKTTIHAQWAQQLLLAKAKVQETTPVFVTLKPAIIPVAPSSMGRMFSTILFAFVGAVFAILYILMKDTVSSAWSKIWRKSE